jgi:hypothetical protein
VLVPESALSTARQVLLEAELVEEREPRRVVAPRALLVGLLVALALGALLIWLATIALH